MERLCFMLELEEGAEAEYDRRHDELWPEMEKALKDAGYTNYTLFRRGTSVIGYAECVPTVEVVLAKVAADPVTPRWDRSFGGVIKSMTDHNGDLVRFREVWRL